MRKLYFLLFSLLTLSSVKGWSQTTIVSEDFENSVSLFSNSGGSFYTGNSASGDRPATSPFAVLNTYAFGVTNGTATLTSNAINTTGYNSIQLSMRLASFSISSTGNGADGGDIVKIEISPDGGTNYYPTLQVSGNSSTANAYWAYSATGLATTPYDGDPTAVAFAPASGGSRTTDGYSTMAVTGLPSVSDLRVKITLLNNSTGERWVIDDFKITGISAGGTPTKLVVTSISPTSPLINTGFSVTVQSQDNSGNPQNVTSNTGVGLSVNTGTGTLGGTVSGTINSGSSSVVISGVTYNVAESGVSLTATATSGMSLTAGNSSTFTVLANASQLAFVNIPSTGTMASNLNAFTVEARRPDNTVDNNFTGNITIAKASGPGTLSGTTTVAAVNGVATFNNLQFDQAGTYTLSASSSGLSGAVSGNIVVSAVQPFTSGNLVVYRVGDGSAALTSNATAAFIDEYTPAGSLVRSVSLPTVVAGANKRITAAGTSTSEGLITRSANKTYLLVTGYDASVGTATVANTTSTAVNRVIGRIDNNTTIDASTALTDFGGANNIRSATSTNGTDLWVAGGTGVAYTTLGSTTSTSLTSTNIRQTNIFSGQLYGSSASGSFRLTTIGTGTPTSTGQTVTNLPGFPTGGSPYGYYFADLDATVPGIDVVYVADDASSTGFQKFSLVAGSWTANGNVPVTGNGLRGLTAVVSGTTVTLYGTSGTNIFSLVDASGYNATLTGTPSTIATASTNTAFRGIALTPEATSQGPLPVKFINVKATQKSNGILVNWTNETESEMAHYAVERSSDGRSFTELAQLNPTVNNGSKAAYQYLDASPSSGDNLYRIRALEVTGKVTYSNIVRINSRLSGVEINLYPNPVRGEEIGLQISNLPAGNYTISVYNTTGQLLNRLSLSHAGGSISQPVSVKNAGSGIYSVQLSGPVQLQKQFIIQ